MMTQWLPLYQLPPEASDLITSTFVEVFPHTLMFVGHGWELILVGSRSPIDLRHIEQRFFQQKTVLADLGRLGLKEPISLLARIVNGQASLRREYGGH